MSLWLAKEFSQYSRAVDDSEDSDWDKSDSEENDQSVKATSRCVFRLSPNYRNDKLSVATLVVGVGPSACGFLRSHLLDQDCERVGLITCGFSENTVNSLSQTSIHDASGFVYNLGTANLQVLVVLCSQPPSVNDCHDYSHALFSKLDTETMDAVILSSESIQHFKSNQPPSAFTCPFLTFLKTSYIHGNSPAAAQLLTHPNLVTGLAAELLSLCQMRRVPAILYQSYYSDLKQVVTLDSMQIFTPTLKFAPLQQARTSWPTNSQSVMSSLLTANSSMENSTVYT